MAATRRNIGPAIPEGLAALKRSEHGRMTTLPTISAVRERAGLPQSQSLREASNELLHSGVQAFVIKRVARRSSAGAQAGRLVNAELRLADPVVPSLGPFRVQALF